MSDSTPSPAVVSPKLNPVSLMLALGSDVRWRVLKLLADGRKMSVTELATAMGYTVDAMGRQMKVMSAAGVIDAVPGEKDGRKVVCSIPAARRTFAGVIDYGFCVIDLNKV